MEERGRVELLAPAGNAEGFYGAIHAGADAVYLAGERFGARAYAENFTTEALVACVRYGHLLGRKIYLAVNTLLKESEIDGLETYLRPFYEAGLDAVIVQDLGVFRLVRECFPGWKIHVSTQMTLCGSYGARLLREMGASRIVPARELSLRELAAMKREAGIEIEMFIHGAMCYCYSGQCLFSSILGGRSGNRGRCAQPCRLPYSGKAGAAWERECYPLSLKDLCTIGHLPQLIEAGMDSLKIEGRMKKPEYAAGVTAIYRRYIDWYDELREKQGAALAAQAWRLAERDQERLASLYIRSGLQDGYSFRRGGREMVTMESPAYSGSDEKVLTEIREKYLTSRLKLPVSVKARFRVGQPAEVVYAWQGVSGRAAGHTVERAARQAVTQENIRRQLGKLGDSAFSVSEMEIDIDEDCFYPLKQLNELRRTAVSALEEGILASRGYRPLAARVSGEPGCPAARPSRRAYAFAVSTLAQLEAVAEWFSGKEPDGPLRFYIEGDLVFRERQAVRALCGKLPGEGRRYLALPYILRESDRAYLERLLSAMGEDGIFQGFLARSMDGLGFVREQGRQLPGAGLRDIPCRADAGVYAWNRWAVGELSSLVEGFCLPYELRAGEQRSLLDTLPCEKIVYGRIPMMLTANCLRRTFGQCGKGGAEGELALLRDRRGSEFPVAVNCLHCMNIIYNSVPLSLHQALPKWKGRVDLRMDFTIESPREVKALLDAFLEGAPCPVGDYTTGHEKRGVE